MLFIKKFEEISIRDEYRKSSPNDYYKNNIDKYYNPHSNQINKSMYYLMSKIDIGYFLDLACGDGIISNFLSSNGHLDFKGCDPFFYNKYFKKFKKECYKYSFEDISRFGIPEKFDTIICSYALHLCDKSYFNNLIYNLSISTKNLIVISPSKYPILNNYYFECIDYKIIDRTHNRIFKSKILN